MKQKTTIMYRSARTGLAVTKAYAKAHPRSTVKETNKRRRTRKRKKRT